MVSTQASVKVVMYGARTQISSTDSKESTSIDVDRGGYHFVSHTVSIPTRYTGDLLWD